MRKLLIISLVLYSVILSAQDKVVVKIEDSETGNPVAYCHVINFATQSVTVSNGDGMVYFEDYLESDLIHITHVGYMSQVVSIEELKASEKVLLRPTQKRLEEFVFVSDYDYLYDILDNCRQGLMTGRDTAYSKVYYNHETWSKVLEINYPPDFYYEEEAIRNRIYDEEKPIEQLQAFFNSEMYGAQNNYLDYKNGRTALAINGNYFVTLNVSKVFSQISLTGYNHHTLDGPLQFKKKSVKKYFELKPLPSDSIFLRISFEPKKDHYRFFSGEIWIERGTNKLAKLVMNAKNTTTHPFIPLYASDSIYRVSYSYTAYFQELDGQTRPSVILLDYGFNYESRRQSGDEHTTTDRKIVKSRIRSKSMMYFYDFHTPFVLPYIDYLYFENDYYTMSLIPFNQEFWENNKTLELTKSQKENFGFLADSGLLVNYDYGNYGDYFLGDLKNYEWAFLFDNLYPFWTSSDRLDLDPTWLRYSAIPNEQIPFKKDEKLMNFHVEILLDCNELDDTLHFKSYTIFTHQRSWYRKGIDNHSRAYVNIYFDLCEIKRREMMEVLEAKDWDLWAVDSIYKATMDSVEALRIEYMNTTQLGDNMTAVRKYNAYVKEKLFIDNLGLFIRRPDDN